MRMAWCELEALNVVKVHVDVKHTIREAERTHANSSDSVSQPFYRPVSHLKQNTGFLSGFTSFCNQEMLQRSRYFITEAEAVHRGNL